MFQRSLHFGASGIKSAVALIGLALLALTIVQPGPVPITTASAKVSGARRHQLVEAYGKLPLSFEPNQGQADGPAQFLSRGPGYTLLMSSTEAVLSLNLPQSSQRAQRITSNSLSAFSASSAVNLRMKLIGANPAARATAEEKLPGKSNYFIGNDPSKWRTNVPNYARVRYREVYPGVDLVYYGNPSRSGRDQRQLEYDFVVAPGADPKAITLGFEGADKSKVDAQGNLVLHRAGGEVHLRKPRAYQEADGHRHRISSGWVVKACHQAGFEVGVYDRSKPLVIDPVGGGLFGLLGLLWPEQRPKGAKVGLKTMGESALKGRRS